MEYPKIIAASAFIQGVFSTGILAYSGPDCTGEAQEFTILTGCLGVVPRLQYYRENGLGPHEERIVFYSEVGCDKAGFLYDTWACDGDYFHSHQCYNLDSHSPNGEQFSVSISVESEIVILRYLVILL